MNYIREINAFYDWLEVNELSQSSVLLWHALMHLNNKCGWQESFTVARTVIEAKSGLRKDAYYTARNNLKMKGLIDFKERKNKAAVFKIYSLLSEKQTTIPTTTQTVTQTTIPTTTQTITKLKETKQNETNNLAYARVIQFAQKCFMTLSQKQMNLLDSYFDDLGEELVTEAMRRSRIESKKFDYAAGILRKWYQKGIKTIDDVARDDNEFEKYKNSKKKQDIEDDGYDYGF